MLYEMELRSAFPTMSSFAWSGKVHGNFSVSIGIVRFCLERDFECLMGVATLLVVKKKAYDCLARQDDTRRSDNLDEMRPD